MTVTVRSADGDGDNDRERGGTDGDCYSDRVHN